MVACAKHFVGDGGTEMGKNEGDTIASYDDMKTWRGFIWLLT